MHCVHHRRPRRPIEEPPVQNPALRTSDAERESTVARLREHGAAGRLDVEELEQRVGAAYQARTRGDLAILLDDLPSARSRPVAARRRQPHGDWNLFVAVSVLLVLIWALTGAGYFWPVWPIAGWGLALAMETAPRVLRPR